MADLKAIAKTWCQARGCDCKGIEERLTAIVREAENAAFERAALIVSDGKPVDGIHTIIVGRHYASLLRALKHPQADAETGKGT